jgi:hypothetical protein
MMDYDVTFSCSVAVAGANLFRVCSVPSLPMDDGASAL